MRSALTRLPLLDCLRGWALVNMVIFHLCYDLEVVAGVNSDWPWHREVLLWQHGILWLFVLVGGMSCALSSQRGRWLHGLRLQLWGLLVTLATVLALPSESIYYGVLTFFGSALWLTALVERSLAWAARRLPLWLWAGLTLLGVALCYRPARGVAALGDVELWRWPQWLQVDALAVLGFHSAGFASADYVPLLPHIFVFWLGYALQRWLGREHPAWLRRGAVSLLTLPGRHSLLVYLLHQPLLLAVLAALGVVEL